MRIGVYTPVFNQADWLAGTTAPAAEWVVSDNRSEDGSADLARRRGARVVVNQSNIGRVGNWNACLATFRAGDHEWLKWLFAGDELAPDGLRRLSDAVAAYPAAGLVVAEYDVLTGGRRRRWSTGMKTGILDPQASLRLVARRGNWFGSPIGMMIRRGALGDLSFSELDWAADFQLALRVAARAPTLYLAEPVGVFVADQRRFYRSHSLSSTASLQELQVRIEATDLLAALGAPASDVSRLRAEAERSAARVAAVRRLIRARAEGRGLLSAPGDVLTAAAAAMWDPGLRRALHSRLRR